MGLMDKFIKAKEASPWKNEPLMRPMNSNYARYCAKHNFKQNKPINGIMNYIYYFYLKIIKWHWEKLNEWIYKRTVFVFSR